MSSKRTKKIVIAVAMTLAYLTSYTCLSRNGVRYAHPYGVSGYYFVPPQDHVLCCAHKVLVVFYYPLIAIEGLNDAPARPIRTCPDNELT